MPSSLKDKGAALVQLGAKAHPLHFLMCASLFNVRAELKNKHNKYNKYNKRNKHMPY